jgi:hypothetical protein
MSALFSWRGVAWLAAAVLAGCAVDAPPPRSAAPSPVSAPPHAAPSSPAAPVPATDLPGAMRLACEDGVELRAVFQADQVLLSGLPAGAESLLRDAGGVSPRQSVYSSPRVRAEFGLGPEGREAAVHLLQSFPRTLHCRHL